MYKLSIIIPVYNQEELIIRALDSIPRRKDIEIIVIDDGSTDKTFKNVLKYREEHTELINFMCLYNETNKGVAYTVNKGYDNASGEYIVLLGSDDYFYTEELDKQIDELDDKDLIYFNLKINDGTIWKATPQTKERLCGSVKFMRRKFIGDTRCPLDKKAGEDYIFYQELLKKKPTERFTDKVVKHYNFPRKNSLTNLASKGEI